MSVVVVMMMMMMIIIIIIIMLKRPGSGLHARSTQSINKTRTPKHADQHIVQCIDLVR